MKSLLVSVRKFFIVLTLCGVLLTYLICTQKPKEHQKVEKSQLSKNASTKIYILYWTPFWNQQNFAMGFGSKPFEQCTPYKNCYATNNRSMLPLEEFDALFFHALIYNKTTHGVPWIRSSNQRYVYVDSEAPSSASPNLKPYNSFYNWTLTYRFDSNIVKSYGKIIKEKTQYSMPSREFLNNKTKLVAWFVSHCRTWSKREFLVKEMQKYISVDVYGKCGPFECNRKGIVSPVRCYKMLEQKYKFYLSFENSYCRDYASEKLYNVLKLDVIPVVYGGGDYKVIAPPKSVINVEDFKSTEQLVDYLQYLDQHQEEYLKYFEWKKKYKVTKTFQSTICQICTKLHEPANQSVYYDLEKWWLGGNTSAVCKTGKNLPQIVSTILPS